MTATINACLDQLATDLRTALVPLYAEEVFDFRTLYDQKEVAVSLSHLSTVPASQTTGGFGRAYEFAAYMTARHTGDEVSLERAERAINDLENAIFDALDDSKNTLWMKVEFHRASTKPGAPDDPGVRYGAVYFRLQLK